MRILADENIPLVQEAFGDLGELSTLSGRDISNADVADTDILLVRSVTQVNQSLLANTPVRFVASATAGFNHVDVEYLSRAGIGFARAPGSNALSAAEYVIAAICYWSLQKERPLEGLSLGIIGCGNVGSRVAKLTGKLGLRCICNDPPLEQQGQTGLHPIEDALDCDIVTLHVPLETSGDHPTLNLLNADRVKQLRPGTLLINAARGEVLDEATLLERVKADDDLELIIDVWQNEPLINQTLLSKTLLGTPHIAGYSYDGKIRGTEMIYQAVCEFLGKTPDWKPQLPISTTNLENRNDIRETVLQAYDILSDNLRLKAVLSGDIDNPAAHFDGLRKNYPIRREFSPQLFDFKE